MSLVALADDPPLLRLIERILVHPHRELVVETPLVALEDLTEPETEAFLELVCEPGALRPAREEPIHFVTDDGTGRRFQFTEVYDRRPRITTDTYPNRFLKYVLMRYRDALKRCHEPGAVELVRALNGLLARSVLATAGAIEHVDTSDSVLTKDPDYRRVLQFSLRLAGQ